MTVRELQIELDMFQGNEEVIIAGRGVSGVLRVTDEDVEPSRRVCVIRLEADGRVYREATNGPPSNQACHGDGQPSA